MDVRHLIIIALLTAYAFVDQSDLKTVEYHMEGGSDMSLHLTQRGQLQGKRGTRVVYVPASGKRRC